MKKNFVDDKRFLMPLLFVCLLFSGIAAPADLKIPAGWNINARPMSADFSSGAQNLVWSRDGKWVACQGDEGIVIRDGSTLQARHFLSREALGWNQADLNRTIVPRLLGLVGTRLALAYTEPMTDSNEFNIRIEWREIASGKILSQWRDVKLSSDNRAAYFTGKPKNFRVYHFDSQKWFSIFLPLHTSRDEPDIPDKKFNDSGLTFRPEVYFSPDGTRAADQTGDGRLRLWNTQSRRQICILKDKRGSYVHNASATGPVVWSPDKKFVATLGEDPEHQDFVFDEGPNDGSQNLHSPVVKVWNAQTGKLLHWWRIREPNHFYWLDRTRVLVSGENSFEICNALNGKQLSVSKDDTDFQIQSVQSLSPDKTRLATVMRVGKWANEGSMAATAIFNIKTSKLQTPISVTQPIIQNLERISWKNDGNFLAVSSRGYTAVWRTLHNQPQTVEAILAEYSLRMGWTNTGRLWTGSLGSISFRDSQKSRQQTKWSPSQTESSGSDWNGLFITPDEKTFLALPRGGRSVLRLDSGKTKPQIWLSADSEKMPPTSGSFSESLSPDGRFYVVPKNDTDSEKPICTLYDLTQKNRKLLLEESPRQGQGDARNYTWENIPKFARDGKRVAFGGRIFSLPDGKVLSERRNPLDGNTLALASHGAFIARLSTYEKNAGLRLFDAASGKLLRTLSLDAGGIATAEFSPDDRVLCIARFGDLEFYDVSTGKLLSKAVVLPSANASAKSNAARGVTWRVR